ncbi:leucine-rich repeat-containing protein 23 [Gambusia affinis]|uniref:leucine-rich repeat-containing protein 23-like n=1 Tax=Gambusia affinis TaxID=33528 RepID=UPI001CDBC02E|nr:leucine-rich repeat-containing protein 23-like [Gambusia affinis]XP_043977679.1 leucine-rich repeat-containing protein 23 [Gambusia affinis]
MSDDDVYLSPEEQLGEDAPGEGEEGDDLDKIQAFPLNKETIIEGLSLLCQTGKRLEHAFIKLDLKERALTDIVAISNYIHIRFLDLSNNHISDLSPLAPMTHLLWLKVDSNSVTTLKGQPLAEFTFLQWLSVASNQLVDLEGLVGPSIETLILSGNSIQKVSGLQNADFGNLVILELRGNQLETTSGFDLPNLRKLYLAQNFIKRLEGLEKLERLTTLHLRDNQLETLEGLCSEMKCLQYLNIRGNAITEGDALRSLRLLTNSLKSLVIAENPVVDTILYRPSILILLPQLERIDKEVVTLKERTEAQRSIRELRDEEEAPVSND